MNIKFVCLFFFCSGNENWRSYLKNLFAISLKPPKKHFGIEENHEIKLSFTSKSSSTINYISTMNTCFWLSMTSIFRIATWKRWANFVKLPKKKKRVGFAIRLIESFDITSFRVPRMRKDDWAYLVSISQLWQKNKWTSPWPLICFQSKCNESFLMVEKV